MTTKRHSIPMKRNLAVAAAVLRAINRIGVTVPKDDIHVESYANLREQGYCIKVWQRSSGKHLCFSFSECRTSDRIAIYIGLDNQFDTHNVPNNEGIELVNFEEGEHDKAAKYIVGRIQSYYYNKKAV